MKRKQRDFIVVSDNTSNKRLAKSSLVQNDISMKKAAAQIRLANTLSSRALQRNGNLKQETGYVDFTNTFNCDTTGTIALIATVAQGASTNQRIGKKIRWESIQIRGQVLSNAATLIADAAVIIVYDKRPTGVLPAITDILVTSNSNSLNNDTNSGRFQILRRMNFLMMGNSAAPTTGREGQDVNEFVPVKRPGVFKSAGTGAIGDIEEGCLYIVSVGNIAVGTAAATAQLAFRVRYKDM